MAGLLAAALVVAALGSSALAATVGVARVKTGMTTVAGCKTTAGTVTLTAAAPTGGATVKLASSSPAATVPASVFVGAGKLSAGFTVKTVPVSVATTATITGSYNATSKSAALTVRPIGVAGVIVKPVTIAGGETAWGRARLECVAAPGVVAVDVASTNTAVARPTVARIRVPAGIKDGYFAIKAEDAAVSAGAQVTARTSAGSTRSATLSVTPTPATTGMGGYLRPSHQGLFDPLDVYESSGLEHSVRNPGVVYLLDDGPGTDEVWAVPGTGGASVRMPLSGFVGKDTEDLAVAPCGAGSASSCLYIGDIGDNTKKRTSISILRLPEPDLGSYSGAPLPYTSITLKYPAGARNAETLLVDDAGLPLVVTKDPGGDNKGAARLYGATAFATSTMNDFGSVPVPLPARPWSGNANLVTGGDAKDGAVVLRTYDHAVEYRGTPGQSLRTFGTWPKAEVPVPREPKGEAISYRVGACGYVTVSETVGDLWGIGC